MLERRQQRLRIIARDVKLYFVDTGVISADTSSHKEYSVSLSFVERFLLRKCYKRGENDHRSYRLSSEYAIKHYYVCEMAAVLERQERVMNVNESYI